MNEATPQLPLAPDPMHPVPVQVTRYVKENEDTFTLTLQPPTGYQFAAGQFNMLYAFGVGEVPISVSGDPAKPQALVHTVRIVGEVTAALSKLRKGDFLGLRGPFGSSWPLPRTLGRDVVVVAGGIGLAPLRPVIYFALKHRRAFGRLAILYGARSPSDLLFKKEIEKWRGRLDTEVEVTVDRGDHTWRGHTGVVTKLMEKASFDPVSTIAMLCGPEVMIRFAARELEAQGVEDRDIYVSLERNMKCGVGLCGHCQLGREFICKDGPVYDYDHIRRLMAGREL